MIDFFQFVLLRLYFHSFDREFGVGVLGVDFGDEERCLLYVGYRFGVRLELFFVRIL